VKTLPKRKTRAKRALPTKQLADELANLRGICREIVERYSAEVERDIDALVTAVAVQAKAKDASRDRVHDMRDMLMLLRGLEVKPAKGRRRDLKRVENVLEELARTAERW